MIAATQRPLAFEDPAHELALSILADQIRRYHRGRRNAVTLAELARRMMIPRRTVHDLVAALVIDRRLPVGTSGKGVFWICDDDDRRVALRYLYPRGCKIMRRYMALKGITAERLAEQLKLELENDQ